MAMTGEIEAAGDALTSGIVAETVERESNAGGHGSHGQSQDAHDTRPSCSAIFTVPLSCILLGMLA